MIILDTNVLSELMRPKPSPGLVASVAKQPTTELFTTSITEAEIFYGIQLPQFPPIRLLKKYFPGSFRTESGLQVLESSFAGMIEITKLVHSSAAC